MIDIQNCIKAQESKGYEQWSKIHNLKQAAKTLNFLTEHKIEQYADLTAKISEIAAKSEQATDSLKATEKRLADMAVLIKNVTTFIEQNLKYCSVCLSRYGFHSYYHQLTGIEECPWHPEEKLITDKTRSYIIASGKSYAYGYEAFSNIYLLSPCLTEELPFPENLPDLPYNMVYISAPQEYISKMKVPVFEKFSEFKIIARSGEDLKLKYSKMLETIADKLNGTAEEKDLAKQYMPDNLDTETDFYNLILFLLVQKRLACYNKEEIQQGIAYVKGSNQKDANPDIVRFIQFAQNIFHCKDTQTIFQRKIFSHRSADNRNYIPVSETIYTEYIFDFQIYDILQSEKQIVSLKYPCFLVAEKSDGKIGFYLFEALENNGYESLDRS